MVSSVWEPPQPRRRGSESDRATAPSSARARLLERWIRVAEVRERLGPVGGQGVERRSYSAVISVWQSHRSAVCSEISLQCMLWYQPFNPAPSTGASGSLGEATRWEGRGPGGGVRAGRRPEARPLLQAPFTPGTVSESSPASARFFSEEDNYSQGRELLLQVRPHSLAFPPSPPPPTPFHLVSVTVRRVEAAALSGAKFQEVPRSASRERG